MSLGRRITSYNVCYTKLLRNLLAHAQNESQLSPFWNPVIANPGFAGFDNTTSLRTGNHFYQLNDSIAFNLFYATYDTYSDKLKGGIAFYFP